MNPLNKYEMIGVFASVAVMALALAAVRFNTELFVMGGAGSTSQEAAITESRDTAQGDTKVDSELEGVLRNSFTPDGRFVELVKDDVRIGTGAEVKEGDTLTVHYVGTTQDGIKFDSSYERGEPFTFTVGEGRVISGWEKGLVGMKVGGQRILVIPPDMAYGNRQVGMIPPNSPLVFAVELLEIKQR